MDDKTLIALDTFFASLIRIAALHEANVTAERYRARGGVIDVIAEAKRFEAYLSPPAPEAEGE